MRNEPLTTLLYMVQRDHNKDAMQEIIERFQPIIQKTARRLNYDGSESDLIINLIEKLYSLGKDKVLQLDEGQAVNYIASIVRNKGIDINRKRSKTIEEVALIETHEITEDEFFINCTIADLLQLLNERQEKVIILKYFYGYSDVEIGKLFGISRQAVNKIHRKSIEILRNEVNTPFVKK